MKARTCKALRPCAVHARPPCEVLKSIMNDACLYSCSFGARFETRGRKDA
jgi:hypothetical protein